VDFEGDLGGGLCVINEHRYNREFRIAILFIEISLDLEIADVDLGRRP